MDTVVGSFFSHKTILSLSFPLLFFVQMFRSVAVLLLLSVALYNAEVSLLFYFSFLQTVVFARLHIAVLRLY